MDIIQLENTKNQIRSNIEWVHQPTMNGGQSIGILRSPPITLHSHELDLKITVGYHRSMIKNKELALSIFENAMDQILTK